MIPIKGVFVAYYFFCKRRLWLYAHGIQMEQTSDIVEDGRQIGETTYMDRPTRYTQLELPGIKIDFYDPKEGIVHEVKRSESIEAAHEAQVKYYLYILEEHGLLAKYGILEYPKQRHRAQVTLMDEDRHAIPIWLKRIKTIIESDLCPPVIHKPICKKCSYYDFCYVGEEVS